MRVLASSCVLLAMILVAAGCDDLNGDVIPPSEPDGVYSITGDSEVQLYWHGNDEVDLAGYRVYRGSSIDGPFGLRATVYTTGYSDLTATNGTTYYYRVSAFDNSGNESPLSEAARDTPRPEGSTVLYIASGTLSDRSGFDFGSMARVAADCSCADVYFDTSGSLALFLTRSGANIQIQDAGYATIDEGLAKVDWAPDAGWSPTGTVEVITGHAYVVWTEDNHFGAFYVRSIDPQLSSVSVDWSYQLDAGNPELTLTAGGAAGGGGR